MNNSGIVLIVPPNGNSYGAPRLVPIIRRAGVQCNLTNSPRRGWLNVSWRTRGVSDFEIQINTPSAIKKNENKRLTRLNLQKCLPDIAIPTYQITDGTNPPKYPVVIRPDEHRQGKNIYLANNKQELNALVLKNPTLSHYMPLVFPNFEFRCWVAKKFDGTVISLKMQEKEAVGFDDTKEFRPKNHSLGNSFFKYITGFKYKKTVREAAKNAMIYSPLQIGAVDLLWDTTAKKVYVLEINSRFALQSDSTVQVVADYLIEYFNDWYRANI